MLPVRVIPSLLIKNGGLVKTTKFRNPVYIGDPINAVRIFNDKEVNELVLLDVDATRKDRKPDFELLSRINTEAFMPLGYGGGVRDVATLEKILSIGYEKIIINNHALMHPEFIRQAAEVCGSQSVVVCIDVKKTVLGKYSVFNYKTGRATKTDPVDYALDMEKMGAGEIILYSIDREGTFQGYDIGLLKQVCSSLDIPVVALGGAGSVSDFVDAVQLGGASGVSAGSYFVFHGKHRAVLITYPDEKELALAFKIGH